MLVYGDVIVHQDLHPLLDPPVDCQFQTIKPTSQQMLNFAAIDSLSCTVNHHLPNWKHLLHNMTSLHELFHGQRKACLCFTFLPLIVGMPTHIHYTVRPIQLWQTSPLTGTHLLCMGRYGSLNREVLISVLFILSLQGVEEFLIGLYGVHWDIGRSWIGKLLQVVFVLVTKSAMKILS